MVVQTDNKLLNVNCADIAGWDKPWSSGTEWERRSQRIRLVPRASLLCLGCLSELPSGLVSAQR